MTGSPVNGYTARMASALVLRMMAASVVNANEWSWRPWTVMPEVQLMMSGTRAAEELMRFSMGSVRLLDGIPVVFGEVVAHVMCDVHAGLL